MRCIDINDKNLICELKKHNEDAMNYLIHKYISYIKAILKTSINDQYMLDECIDDVLFAIWQNIKYYDENKTSLKNWIAGVTQYKKIDMIRKIYKKREECILDVEDLKKIAFSDTYSFEDELSREVKMMLDILSDKDKMLFIRLYIKGEEIADIAKDMNEKRENIYNRLKRAKDKIKRHVGGSNEK